MIDKIVIANRFDAQFLAGPQNAQGYLTTVGDKNRSEHAVLFFGNPV